MTSHIVGLSKIPIAAVELQLEIEQEDKKSGENSFVSLFPLDLHYALA